MGTPAEKLSGLCHSALGYRPPAPGTIELIPGDPGYAMLRQDLWLDFDLPPENWTIQNEKILLR
jgi:hypothetical protein